MELEKLYKSVKELDAEMGQLFAQRMELCGQIAREKAARDMLLPEMGIRRAARANFCHQADDETEDYADVLYSTLQELADSYESRVIGRRSKTVERMRHALDNAPLMFPEKANVTCQGVEGAYSQIAAQKLFRKPTITYVPGFEGVFEAIESGKCRYGVLPIENSTAGSVNRIYDLMIKYNFSIVRSVRVKIDHNLLVRPGVQLEDIREVFSHEQAIAQSSQFLRAHPNIKATACANTAMAAKMVAESDRRDVAALGSYNCADLYGLDVLQSSVQDKGNNYTRFICIGKKLEIFPGADRTSVMMPLSHKPGALYRVMARINALDINLTKLESRPLPDRDFEFMFYFDLDTPVYSPRFLQLMADLENECENFRYLGSYSVIV